MAKLFISLFCFGFLMTGCMTYTVPVVDVKTGDADFVGRKIPLKVGIVIPDENFTLTKTVNEYVGQSTLTVPFGKLIDRSVSDIFRNVFESVEILKGNTIPPGIDALFVCSVEDFDKQFDEGIKPGAVSVSLKSRLTDPAGVPLWSKTIQVREEQQQPVTFSVDAMTAFWGGLFARATAKALKETCLQIVSSEEVHRFASAKGMPAVVAGDPPGGISPTVKSDVDELPKMTVRQNKSAYAIVVGIETYRQKLPRADFASQDARLVADYLTKALGYPEENVVTLLNDRALKSDFEKYFEKWLQNNVEKDGTVFIYYSGHGAPNPKTGDAYLVPYDGDPSFIEQTGYPLKRMYASLGELRAKSIIVALDSCFSGAGGRSVLAQGARPLVMNLQTSTAPSKNMTVITAASGDQISSTYMDKGHGLFTYFMLKGIRNEDVVNPDGSIRMDDLYGYLKPQVERIARKQYNNEQTPQLIGAK